MVTDLPGLVSLEWRGYRIDTTVAFLFGAVVLMSFTSAVVYRFWLFLRRTPGNMAGAWKAKRRQRGYQALTRGMVAVAAGDAIEADRQVKRADVLLDEPPLTMLVSAQSAQMKGDEEAANKFFTAMVKRPETEFLGLRGLLNQAIKRGDKVEALSLVRRAHRLQPKSTWVASNMFDLQIRTGQWLDARVTCDDLARGSLIDKDDAKRRKAVLSYQLSLLARDAGDGEAALGHLRDANKLAPGFVPAVADLAGRWVDGGKAKKAAKLIEGAWGTAPHPDLLEPYWRACNASDALDRVRATEKLVESQPRHLESLIALARASLDARLWGEARQYLEKALAAAMVPQARICRMMAELEEVENADSSLAREWLMRASQAAADPAWVCDHCGNTVAQWSVVCGKCEEFDRFDWRIPESIQALPGGGDLEDDMQETVQLPPRGIEAG
ncbi:MAG: heme biosynthesis HemY N-terminal domain-containing protein [Alphaproteobacteria bacterium]|nr:heme biosynthesis HemY N-terminal domain-containing protein [Alphaproteobacteria bacterium]